MLMAALCPHRYHWICHVASIWFLIYEKGMLLSANVWFHVMARAIRMQWKKQIR